MKRFLLAIFSVCALGIGANAQVGTYSVGDVVDDFTVTDTDGNEHNLYSITASGKYVYLDFFFDTCGPCQGASPHFGEFYDKYGCNSGEVYCLVINNGSDSDAEVIAYEEEFGGPGHHAPAVSADGGSGAVDDAFGVGAYPTFCLIGPDNRLMESDIWPVSSIADFEATFGGDFNPDPMPCSFAGVEEQTALTEVSVYPNPANTMTTVAFSAEAQNEVTITVYNMLGEVMESNLIQAVAGQNIAELDLAGYESGNYIVQIQLGEAIMTSKLEILK